MSTMTRREMMGTLAAVGLGGAAALPAGSALAQPAAGPKADTRPNILFCIADDWGFPHAAVYGDKVVKTPAFDRLCREGVAFHNAFCASPSCSPSRASILTGQMFYRLEQGANLWSTLDKKFPNVVNLLEQAGYFVGLQGKGWGPGDPSVGGYTRNPAGPNFKSLDAFLKALPEGKPFCFWFGGHDPHRPYEKGTGLKSGKKLADVQVPPWLPDCDEVRSDILDYYVEVERFDSDCARMVDLLEKAGKLDNTIVVMTGDNGMPFPRCKTQLYNWGCHQPLAIRWPARCKGGREIHDFVSHTDYAPTFLQAAGLDVPPDMTGRSLLDLLAGEKAGWIDPARSQVVVGRERHTDRSEGHVGYPCRMIRTKDFLYIRNFRPERWPAGSPPGYEDIDGGPTKTYLLAHQDDPKVKPQFDLCCARRPAEELYDLAKDPFELANVADKPEYREAREKMSKALMDYLTRTKDPRAAGGGDEFDTYPYRGGGGGGKAGKKQK